MRPRFLRDDAGGVAVSFALMAIPLCMAGGIALDYARASMVRSYLQAEADAAALAAAKGGPSANDQGWVSNLQNNVQGRFSSAVITGLTANGTWLTPTDFSVTASGSVPVTLLAVVPGLSREIDVGVRAVARFTEPALTYNPPVVTQLSPDAADYNRIYVYCFNAKNKDKADKGRGEMTAIADNAGTSYEGYKMPKCAAGEALSYRLHNVRNARTRSSKWDDPRAEHYEYYTDTVITGGVESYSLGVSLLETVLCDSREVCETKRKNGPGILPVGSNRAPHRAAEACTPGKFMYYGWEDRPPENGGSDRDYNDIRIVIECPTIAALGNENAWLIK